MQRVQPARSSGWPRSIASVYCARSLVPIERKSAASASCSASSAEAGVSIIAPIAGMPHAELARAFLDRRAHARTSSTSVTIGSRMRHWPSGRTRRMARTACAELGLPQARAHAAHAERGLSSGGIGR
jgi:hypothetical protein